MLSVVVPMYHEAGIVETSAARLLSADGLPSDCELIFSDDGSTDGSAETVRRLSEQYPSVRLVGDGVHRGKGAAVRTGILASRGETVLFTDCDLAYGTEQLIALYRAHLSSGADITVGSRAAEGGGYEGYSALRRLSSAVFRRIAAAAAGLPVRDCQAGLKCFRGDAAREIFAECGIDGFAFDAEALRIAVKKGCRVEEFPVNVLPAEEQGRRKSSVRLLRDALAMLRDLRKIKKIK